MSSRKKVRTKSPNAQTVLTNWLAQISTMLMTRFCYLVLGRSSSKTTEFHVERLIEIFYDMPGAPACWVSDTYSNLQKNVLPSLMEGLERKGYKRDLHYVLEKQPLEYSEAEKGKLPKWLRDNFWKPHNQLATYKHTMIFFTGFNIRFGSLDRPASLAGPSYVHIFGDEVKYFKEQKILNLQKAVRGYKQQFGNSVFYRGHTFTTDMPNPQNVGEYDWILSRGKDMKPEAINRVLKAAIIVNQAAQEFAAAKEAGDNEQAAKKKRTYERWVDRWKLARIYKDAHRFFFIASSYVNVDYLNLEWFEDAIKDSQGDLNTAVLSIKNSLSSGDRFYANLTDRNFYKNGSNPAYDDVFSLTKTEDCRILHKLNRNQKIEIGMDFGNMMSMAIAQTIGRETTVLKFMYTLSPEWIRDAADKFLEYFEPHQEKYIEMYYDRAGNNLKKAGQDMASQMKEALEFYITEDGHKKPTGWRVKLMSVGQGNIGINEEYNFMMELMAETHPKLPKLRLDFFQCKELRSSLQMAPTAKNKRDQIVKDKKSEKLPIHRLPMESTNPSDALKYLMMRKQWRALVKRNQPRQTGSVSIR